MNTPYNKALTVGRREVDRLEASIGIEAEQLDRVERELRRIAEAMERERRLAAEDAALSSDAFFQRMRAEQARLAVDQKTIDARLDLLRGQAREAYGSVRAIEDAAERYRSEAERAIEAREQTQVDDRFALRFSLRLSLTAQRRRSRKPE